ncbi:MAG TPA: hypothetical protein VM802_10100 [Chitinophaga sp.]|uniref:hypothetical protein n=1 Tax=Chitinophaga sp. TaxID=1869181 RepID=UPI002BA5E41F|nr:hypothetical protein [Chitinophaga sp.]HVI45214.1 hypothetical protein [Chitinophaga sp.]
MNTSPSFDLLIKLQEIFPSQPETNVPSEDILHRLASLPVYIRTQTCETLGWDEAKYYRKVAGLVVMTAEEEKKFIEFSVKALKKYYDYIQFRYVLPRKRIRKKNYKKFD